MIAESSEAIVIQVVLPITGNRFKLPHDVKKLFKAVKTGFIGSNRESRTFSDLAMNIDVLNDSSHRMYSPFL